MRKHRGSDLWKDCPLKVPRYQRKSSVSMISLYALSLSIKHPNQLCFSKEQFFVRTDVIYFGYSLEPEMTPLEMLLWTQLV